MLAVSDGPFVTGVPSGGSDPVHVRSSWSRSVAVKVKVWVELGAYPLAAVMVTVEVVVAPVGGVPEMVPVGDKVAQDGRPEQ